MTRKNRKTPAAQTPEDHIEALDQLLTQLKKHLLKSAAEKGTYSDYLRLLEFYSQTNAVQSGTTSVTWVDPDWMKNQDAA
jgi:hypothetical protein